MFDQQQPTQFPRGPFSMDEIANIAYLAINSFATCFTPFVRHTFGRETFGLNVLGAGLILWVYCGLHPGSGAMIDFSGTWFVLLMIHRAKTARLERKGAVIHSRYSGRPWLGHLFGMVRKDQTAVFMEGLCCLLLGCLLTEYDPIVGLFVMAGSVALWLKNGFECRVETSRLRRMRDAEIEQRYLADRYRKGDF